MKQRVISCILCFIILWIVAIPTAFAQEPEERPKVVLTTEEQAWLQNHKTIRIAYEKNFLAFCGYDESTGELKGALRVFVEELEENLQEYGVQVETVPYETVGDSLNALRKHNVDMVFPLYGNVRQADKRNVLMTHPIASTAMTAIVHDLEFDEFQQNTVAVVKGFTDVVWYVEEQYPYWHIVYFDTFTDCVKAVKANLVDCVVESTYVYKTLTDYREIQMVSLSNGASIAFAVSPEDAMLREIMNKAIAIHSDTKLIATMTKYSGVERGTTFQEFARDNMIPLITISGLLLIIMVFFLVNAKIAENHARKAESEMAALIAQQEMQLRRIEELNGELADSKRKADEANLAKTTFLFNMSHDIRTPMNAIVGYSHLIKKEINHPEKVLDYQVKLQKSGEFLLSLINGILDMARIESGKVELEEEAICAGTLMGEVFEIFETAAAEKHITMHRETKIQSEGFLCDSIKTREIFSNLIGNAIKYTPNGGHIEVITEEIPSDREGYICLKTTVSDNGIGMSEEFLPTIFDSFTRERNTTTSKIAGTGLGMPIVKAFVEMMGGTITVQSKLGEGTTFTVILYHHATDLACVEEKKHDIREVNMDLFRGKRILLAEDNDLNAEIAISILEDMGFITDWVTDGELCVNRLEETDDAYYDLILMDIQMPNLDGYDATRIIRNMKDLKKAGIPIVAMTANAFEEDKKNASAVGMNGHLSKPIHPEQVAVLLAKVLCTSTI